MWRPTIDPDQVRWHGICDGGNIHNPGGVRLGVFLPNGPTTQVINFAGVTGVTIENDGTLLERDGVDPTFGLPFEAAYALYTALAQFFEQAPESVSIRKDYDAERARVDRLIGALIERSVA